MTLVDSNVLLYAVNLDAPQHPAAATWTVGFTSLVLLAFLRIVTNRSAFPEPWEPQRAFDQIELWLSSPAAAHVEPTSRHWRVLRQLALPLGVRGNLTSDAHLAALALDYEAAIATTDRDFSRFSEVVVTYVV